MKYIILTISVFLISNFSFAEELQETKAYRLNKTLYDLERTRDKTAGHIAVKNSKFVVVDSGDSSTYVVRFITLYNMGPTKSTVTLDEEYIMPKKLGNVDISKSVSPSVGGPVSGPLIVPFKFRLDDDSITGEAVLGYYAGYSLEPKIPWTDVRVPISPFIAGGLSQVSVSENGETDNKTGFTWAAGILVQNWANVNIGIVYGEDHTGDKDWEHEGEGWFSFMIGWEL
jgi:hypothetical protein